MWFWLILLIVVALEVGGMAGLMVGIVGWMVLSAVFTAAKWFEHNGVKNDGR